MSDFNFTTDNLMYFRENYNNIYHVLRNKERNQKKYQIVSSKSNTPNLLVHLDEGSPVLLYSKYDPIHEAERWIETIKEEFAEVKHLIIYGFGFGYHLQKIIEHFPDKVIYLYEPNIEIMLSAMEARKLDKILSHPNIVTLGIGDDEIVQKSFFNFVIKQISQSVMVLAIPPYRKIFKQSIQNFEEEMKKMILEYRGNLRTILSFQEEWTENILLNLPRILSSNLINNLKGAFKGIPALIIGSGPSLDDDIEYVKKLKDHTLIFAAGSSIQALLHHGVKPHFAVSIDGSEANYQVYHDLDLSGIPFIFTPTLKYKITDHLDNDLLFHLYIQMDTISDYLIKPGKDTPRFYSTTSVTGIVIQLARFLGCNTIIFSGQDLSYPNDSFYSKSVDHVDESTQKERISIANEVVKNVMGGNNKTSKNMLNMIRDIESLINNVIRDCHFINTSKIGASIKGTDWKPIEKVYDEMQTNSFDEDRFIKILNEKKISYDDFKIKKTIQQLTKSYNKIKEIQKQLDEINYLFEGLHNALQRLETKKIRDILENIEKLMSIVVNTKEFEKILSFIASTQISIYKRSLPEIHKEENLLKKAELVNNHLRKLVSSLIEVTPKVLHFFEMSMERLERNFELVTEETQ